MPLDRGDVRGQRQAQRYHAIAERPGGRPQTGMHLLMMPRPGKRLLGLASRPTRVVGVVDGSAEAELDLTFCQVIENFSGVWERARKAVEFGGDQWVAGAAGGERLPLDGQVLPVGRDTGIADQQRVDGLRQ